jgi:hypothetical protein
MALGGLNRPRHQVRRWEGSGRVVDKHDIRFGRRQRLEPSENALLTGRAPDRRGPKRRRGARREMPDRLVVKPAIVSVDHHNDRLEPKACGKRFERMRDKRAASAIEVLLWPICPEPHAPAAGDDQKPNLIRRQLSTPAINRDAFSGLEATASMRATASGALTWLWRPPINCSETLPELHPCR